MSLGAKIILHCPVSNETAIAAFVERCLSEGVAIIAVVGEGCEAVHDRLDDLIVGNGSDPKRFILTSWHEGESLEEVIAFMKSLEGKAETIKEVRL